LATLSKRLSDRKPIAIWERWFCVEISQAGVRVPLASNKRDTRLVTRKRNRGEARGGAKTDGLNEAA
jgi:hypothetical protein